MNAPTTICTAAELLRPTFGFIAHLLHVRKWVNAYCPPDSARFQPVPRLRSSAGSGRPVQCGMFSANVSTRYLEDGRTSLTDGAKVRVRCGEPIRTRYEIT